MTPTPNTTRYDRLASFLEQMMENPNASRRVRLTAASRLDDLLRRQERQEASQDRRAERARREAVKAALKLPTAEEVTQATVKQDREDAVRRAREELEKVMKKGYFSS